MDNARLDDLRRREAEVLDELSRPNLCRGMEIGALGRLKRIRREIQAIEAATDTDPVMENPKG